MEGLKVPASPRATHPARRGRLTTYATGQSLVRVLAASILLLFAAPAFAQVDVVAKYRTQYPTPLSADQKVSLLRQIAGEVHGGLLVKRDGTNCGGYSCDIICFSDVTLFDVLQDQDNAALPRWDATTNPRGYRCELVASAPASPPGSTIPPASGSPSVVPSLDLTPILSRLDTLYAQNERIYADLTHQHADQTAQIVAAVNEPAFIKKFFSNTYVQLALASFASVYATHQVMK